MENSKSTRKGGTHLLKSKQSSDARVPSLRVDGHHLLLELRQLRSSSSARRPCQKATSAFCRAGFAIDLYAPLPFAWRGPPSRESTNKRHNESIDVHSQACVLSSITCVAARPPRSHSTIHSHALQQTILPILYQALDSESRRGSKFDPIGVELAGKQTPFPRDCTLNPCRCSNRGYLTSRRHQWIKALTMGIGRTIRSRSRSSVLLRAKARQISPPVGRIKRAQLWR
ncbi:hypothetical protein C8Q70DRAFT_513823 [Cubamyces menziesii]|nr:hypothetical protein C8Q70DRAFT_513823 [Cubamyces menziesii]